MPNKTLLYFLAILSSLLLVFGCVNRHKSPFKGFNTDDGVEFYKYADLGGKGGRITFGKIMEVNITYSKMNDSVFWNSRNRWLKFSAFLSYDTLLNSETYLRKLLKINPGDSIIYVLPAAPFFNGVFHKPVPQTIKPDTMVKVHVKVVSVLDSAHYMEKIKSYAQIAKDLEMKEQFELSRYVSSNNISGAKRNGVYIIPMKEGNGQEVKSGSNISVSYRGYFMYGKTFDSIPDNDPLQFTIGDSAQVIPGLETGIKNMKEGEKAKIIIPSHSAFGEKGSSTGIVPPYTTVIYEVTVLKIKTDSIK